MWLSRFLRRRLMPPALSNPFTAELPDGAYPPHEGFPATLNTKSEAWFFIKNFCLRRVYELRVSNDNPKLDLEKTAITRGEIKAFQEILSLGEPPKPTVSFKEYEEVEDFNL